MHLGMSLPCISEVKEPWWWESEFKEYVGTWDVICTSSPSSNFYYVFQPGLWERIPGNMPRRKLLVTFLTKMDPPPVEVGPLIRIIGRCWCVHRDIGLTIE